MVSREGVQEGEHPLPSSGIHNLIYPWQRETVFWACIIEVGVIDAHPPFAFLFGYHFYICQPIRVLHFPDESGFQQLVNLIPENLLSVRVKTFDPLSDGSCCWQDVKLMGDDGGVNSFILECAHAKTSWLRRRASWMLRVSSGVKRELTYVR